MDRVVLERRMKMLNAYMHEVCRRTVMDSHIGLKPLLLAFVEQGDYDRATSGHISHTVRINLVLLLFELYNFENTVIKIVIWFLYLLD